MALFAAAGLLPLSAVSAIVTDRDLVIALFGPLIFFASLSMALAPAALQVVTPNQMRGQVSAVWMLVLNLVTAGVGPSAVGVITDYVFGDPLAVGKSIALVNCISVPTGRPGPLGGAGAVPAGGRRTGWRWLGVLHYI